MDALIQYTLPLSGLRHGIHQYEFKVDDEFFSCFENSLIQNATIDLEVTLDKRPDLMILTFQYEGTVRVECDRCLELFDLPISGSEALLVKYSDTATEEGEIIYLTPDMLEWNIAKYVYEYISLAIPLSKTHDEAGEQCDPEMLKYLQDNRSNPEETNPLSEVLKNFNQN